MPVDDTPPRHWCIICERGSRLVRLPVKKCSNDVRGDANPIDQRHRHFLDGDGIFRVGTSKVRARWVQRVLIFTWIQHTSALPTQAYASDNVIAGDEVI